MELDQPSANQAPPADTVRPANAAQPHRPRRGWPLRHALRLAVLLGLLGGAGGASAASLTATVDRNVVPVGESIRLSLIFEGVGANSPPPLPPIANFRTGPSSGYRSEISIVNGRQTARHIFEYTLQAAQPGATIIPSIQAQAGGQVFSTQPINVKVLTAAESAQAQNAATASLAFLRLVVPRTDVYLGEPFPVEIHLYWRSAKDIRMPQLKADGFTTTPPPEPTQSRTQVGNAVYNLAVFRLSARAARSGALTLGPAEESLTLFTRQDFFGQALDPRPTTLKSDAIAMNVLPLPDGAPEGFNGTIGSYQLAVNAGPTSVAVGDPITVRVKITGNGPLDALTYPSQSAWRDFNLYPPTSTVESSDPLGLAGSKNFEQVIIPQNHEIKRLPPFKFSFFDPQARQYRTLTGPEIALNIRAGTGSGTPPPMLTNTTARSDSPREDDLIHIRPHLDLIAASSPLVARPWFHALQIVPVALWLGLFLRRRQSESLANNPRLRRQREVAQRIREGLPTLRAHSEAGRSDDFFALLFRLLQEQLGERLDLPASAITESVIDDHLKPRSLAPDTLQALRELFQACNQARYAPVRDRQELAALVPRLESVLRDLQTLTP